MAPVIWWQYKESAGQATQAVPDGKKPGLQVLQVVWVRHTRQLLSWQLTQVEDDGSHVLPFHRSQVARAVLGTQEVPCLVKPDAHLEHWLGSATPAQSEHPVGQSTHVAGDACDKYLPRGHAPVNAIASSVKLRLNPGAAVMHLVKPNLLDCRSQLLKVIASFVQVPGVADRAYPNLHDVQPEMVPVTQVEQVVSHALQVVVGVS